MLNCVVAKDCFEDEYVDILNHADHSAQEVRHSFDEGCMLCTLYGRTADCEACPIKEAALAKLSWHGVPHPYEWVG